MSVPLPILRSLPYGGCVLNLEITWTDSFHVTLLFKMELPIQVPLHFHIYFRNSSLYLQKNHAGVLTGITLSLYINLGRIDSFAILNLLIQGHSMSLY